MSETDERQQQGGDKEPGTTERQLSGDNDSASVQQSLEDQLKQKSDVANFSNRLGSPTQFTDPREFQEPKLERQFEPTPFQYYQQPFLNQLNPGPLYQIPPPFMQLHPPDQFHQSNFAAHALMTAQNPAPTQPRATTKSSTASAESQPRRLSHNTAEKRRRDKINEGIQELCVLLPPNEDGRKSNNKAVILSRSVEYIRHLEMQYQHLIERHRHLSGENLSLKQFRATLQTQQQVFMGAPTGTEMPQGS